MVENIRSGCIGGINEDSFSFISMNMKFCRAQKKKLINFGCICDTFHHSL